MAAGVSSDLGAGSAVLKVRLNYVFPVCPPFSRHLFVRHQGSTMDFDLASGICTFNLLLPPISMSLVAEIEGACKQLF